MLRWVAILTFACTVPAMAQSYAEEASHRLESARVFAFGGVGFIGRISQGEIDYSAIMAQTREVAEAAFEKVYATGNPQAKAYALTGLKRLDSPKFKELALSAEGSNEQVSIMHGCIFSSRPLRTIAAQMERQNAETHQ